MPTVSLIADSPCGCNDHHVLKIQVNAAAAREFPFHTSEMLEPITPEEERITALTLARLVKVGRTNAQAKTALRTGFSFSI